MDLSQYGPSVNPLAAALAAGARNPSPGGGASPSPYGGSPSTGMPGGGNSPGGGVPTIPGLPPGVMPLPTLQAPTPITSTGVAQLPSAIPAATAAGILPSSSPSISNPPSFGFGTLGSGGGGY